MLQLNIGCAESRKRSRRRSAEIPLAVIALLVNCLRREFRRRTGTYWPEALGRREKTLKFCTGEDTANE